VRACVCKIRSYDFWHYINSYVYVCVRVCATSIVSISQVIGCEDRLRNDWYCVEWGVKLYSNSFVLYLIWHQYISGTLPTVAQLDKIIIGIALSKSAKWQTEFTEWSVRFNGDWYLHVWWARQIHANCRVLLRVSESRFLPKPSKFPLVRNPVIQQMWPGCSIIKKL